MKKAFITGISGQDGSYLSELLLGSLHRCKYIYPFWNSKIGVPWVAATARLKRQQLLDCCDNFDLFSSDSGPCVMGVDQGKDLHVVIISLRFGKPVVVFLGIFQDWQELDYYMTAFSVSRCVVDALPETRNAKEFGGRFPDKVFINYYVAGRKGSYSWNEVEGIVQVDRTESLDETHAIIDKKEIVFPKDVGVVNTFISHCINIAKRLVEDQTTGSKRYVYIKLGEDHFRHALNYALIALSDVSVLTMSDVVVGDSLFRHR